MGLMNNAPRLWLTLAGWASEVLPLLVIGGIVFGAFGLYEGLGLPFIKNTRLMLPAPKSLEQLVAETGQAASRGARELPQEPTTAAVDRYSGYLSWATFVGLYSMFLLVACVAGIYILAAINRSTPPCMPDASVLRLSKGIFVISALLVIAVVNYAPTTLPLLKPTLLRRVPGTVSPPVLAMMVWLDKLGLVAAFYLTFVATAILPPRGRADVRCLHQRAGFLRLILYVGTALLVTDIFQYSALLRWSAAFVDPPHKSSIGSLIATLVSLRGLFSTTYLAAIYLPAALILAERTRATAPEDANPKRQREWLRDQELIPTSIFAQVRPVVAILLPLLTALLTGPAAGVVTEIVKRV